VADSFTPNYALTKPDVGASIDTWGTKTNANWDSVDAKIKANADGVAANTAKLNRGLPYGVIMLWVGALNAIPAGWHLCDGTAGTPDLRERFVLGAGVRGPYDTGGGFQTGNAGTHSHGGATGGTALTIAQIPPHTHTVNDVTHQGGQATTGVAAQNPVATNTGSTGGGQAHTHPLAADGDHVHSATPPYYSLAYIMFLG
jgi:microcystin-dependent protein